MVIADRRQLSSLTLFTQRRAAWGFPRDRILLGGDHLGPISVEERNVGQRFEQGLRTSPRLRARRAIGKSILMRAWLVPMMRRFCPEQTVAQRAAVLCEAAEEALKYLPPGADLPLYVIGTEVPAPGGESAAGRASCRDHGRESLSRLCTSFNRPLKERGLSAAWQRVIGVVVQPGVEFGDEVVFEYDRSKARLLSEGLPDSPSLVYEAHSTDYQSPSALAQMVEDHFAILKVGPWLTFAFREAVFALSEIERELFAGRKGQNLSRVREALDQAMLREPAYWRSYYHGDESQLRLARAYSYSDRCRYYWHEAAVRAEIEKLLDNLTTHSMPLTPHQPISSSGISSNQSGTNRERARGHHSISHSVGTANRMRRRVEWKEMRTYIAP